MEISPNVSPPVCKILDYGRYKYEEQKRQATARSRQKVADLNEVKIRPNIEQHDYEVKCRTISRILSRGDKVRLVVRFRGREITRPERGFEVLRRVLVDLEGQFRVEQEPGMEGRQIVMVLSQGGGGKSRKSVEDIIPLSLTQPRVVRTMVAAEAVVEAVVEQTGEEQAGESDESELTGIEGTDESQSDASDLGS